jgi:hypothetical protein
MAELKWPSVGSTFVVTEKRSGSFGSVTRQLTYSFLGKRAWHGRTLMGIADGSNTSYFEEQGRWVATMRDATVIERAEPGVQNYDWPLLVGKRWSTTFLYQDLARGPTFDSVTQDATVDAYEEVQTPAGNFNTFKISRGDPGYHITYWLSPELGVWVKARVERLSGHYRGVGTVESELVSYSFKE